jgi:hypothetical protein
MTDELESRLRRHLRVVDDTEVASTADVALSARRFAVRRRRRTRIAAAAASVVAVVVAATAVVAILPGGSDEVSIGSSPDGAAPAPTSPAATSPLATTPTPATPPPVDTESSAWAALPPDPRGVTSDPSVVWIGTEAIAIGGLDDRGDPRIGAAAFDPAAETWRTLQDPPIDDETVAAQFTNQLVVWTGTEVLVLGGGSDGPSRAFAPGSLSYDPVVDEWRSIPSPTGPVAANTPSVWTGTDLLVWTTVGSAPDAGAATAFDPATDTWRELSAPPAIHREHAASVWTGTEWIIWGGHRDGSDLDDGAAYDPATDTWRTIADSPLSARRSTAVWTGTEMLIASGSSGNQGSPLALSDGAAYDPVSDSWRPIANGFAHPGFVPVWTGTQLVLFAKGAAAVYDPATDRWIDTCCNETGGGAGGTPVWTGSAIVLLGSHDPDVGGSTFTPDDPGSASTTDVETPTPVETIESDLGLVSFVLPDDVGPYPFSSPALPEFVVGYGRWLVDCCYLTIALQNLDPPIPDEERISDFERNGLTWSLYDSGPRDGTEIIAKASTGALTVLVSAQVRFPDEAPERVAQRVVEQVARSLAVADAHSE